MSMLNRRAALAAALRVAADVAVQVYVSVVGKTIKLIVPFGEAGGSDVWASVVASYLPRHLPGRPSVVIRNVLYGSFINGASGFTTRSRPAGLEFFEAAAPRNCHSPARSLRCRGARSPRRS